MEWKDSYSLGIAEIDNQHKGLLRGFTAIENAIFAGKGWSETHSAVVELFNAAHLHFSFEESLMRMFGFPESDAKMHVQQHQHFFARLEAIERHSLKESAEQEMVTFLRAWLTDHILGSDRAYANFILSGAKIVRAG